MRSLVVLACVLAIVVGMPPPQPPQGGSAPLITPHQAGGHAMRYWLALPAGWTAQREWPVLVVVPDAGREFAANLTAFVRARGVRPYILVAPEVLSCGGAGSRTPGLYSYSAGEWRSLQSGDDFAFEDQGLAAVLADVHRLWHGEARAYLTGWEAGGHTAAWRARFRTSIGRWRRPRPTAPRTDSGRGRCA